MGEHIAKATLPAWNIAIATDRDTDTGIKAVGKADDLLLVKLAINNHEDAHATRGRTNYLYYEGDAPMMTWTSDEFNKIGRAEELQIASLRRDGTLRNPVTIWVVSLSDDLYVRSVNGRTAAWFRGTLVRHEGHIRAGGVDKDVTFVEPDPDINEISAAFNKLLVQHPLVFENSTSTTTLEKRDHRQRLQARTSNGFYCKICEKLEKPAHFW